jgi:hypothetical protein
MCYFLLLFDIGGYWVNIYRITAVHISYVKVKNLVESVNEVKKNNGRGFFEYDKCSSHMKKDFKSSGL